VEEQPQISASGQPENTPELVSLSRYLGMEQFSYLDGHQKTALGEILDWAKEQGAGSDLDIVYRVSQLSNQLGIPPLGQSRLQQLYGWAKLDRMERVARKQKLAYGTANA